MLYNIWRFIQLLLPYWVVILLYKNNRALTANIKTRTGKALKAIMISDKYGILFAEKDYLTSRIKVLKEQQNKVNYINKQIADELNSLSLEARELFFNE